MVSQAKTDWTIDLEQAKKSITRSVLRASHRYAAYLQRAERVKRYTVQSDPLFQNSSIGSYLIQSGLLHRGWISPRIALKALLLAEEIAKLPTPLKNFLFLSFLGLLVPDFSNMSYGPELYRKRKLDDCDVFGLFDSRTNENLGKLLELKENYKNPRCNIRLGDSANGGLSFIDRASVQAIITSPPYLSDHDYSRMTRLELVFTGTVASRDDLRVVKKMLLRSSSKNVYKEDCRTEDVLRFAAVRDVIAAVTERARLKTSGFSKVYPKLVGEYFGGMYRHFQEVGRVLKPGGYAAYIVGDQSSFFAIPIPTARILAQLAEHCGSRLNLVSMEPVRKFRGTRGKVSWSNSEWLILLRKTSGR